MARCTEKESVTMLVDLCRMGVERQSDACKRNLDGGIYDGEWKDDLKNGKGKINFANGDHYDGEWKSD